jgi:hypothetical protein
VPGRRAVGDVVTRVHGPDVDALVEMADQFAVERRTAQVLLDRLPPRVVGDRLEVVVEPKAFAQ